MSEIAIKVEGLGKRYTIGKEKDGSLRGSIANIFKSAASKGEDFWALKDVSFEVNKGDVIGIIGKNGAGKSTLLKVLSQITKPTEGRIEINGRVASLLEVGTGFHPELTGRENIFLNGTILGMTRKEVASKFDEIVEFSGIRKFIDTPVKRYSSGQYVRLAFAVAAHLEPEILIIDEVLAVGDAEFQKKCLGKMKDVAGEGRTVLFVSHNISAVKHLCNSAILIKKGEVVKTGPTEEITSLYLNLEPLNKNILLKDYKQRKGNQFYFVEEAYWVSKRYNRDKVHAFEECSFVLKLQTAIKLNKTRIDIGINNSLNERIIWFSTSLKEINLNSQTISFDIRSLNLVPGFYNCNIFISTGTDINDWLTNVSTFEVVDEKYYDKGFINHEKSKLMVDFSISGEI